MGGWLHWAEVWAVRGEGERGGTRAQLGKEEAAGWAGRGKEERELGSGWFWVELVGSLGVGLGVWAPFLISFLSISISFTTNSN